MSTTSSTGTYPSDEVVATVGDTIRSTSEWPIRRRGRRVRRVERDPFVTGQRVLDVLQPIAKGSSATVIGGFGEGKTMLLEQLAKWGAADVIVYVGCGERGNELADLIDEIAQLVDPRTGRALLERTIILANTSNMPVMAREASIYTAVTIAEYFRDMGAARGDHRRLDLAMGGGTRELASRTGAIPAEQGYPADLPAALAAFYQRAGCVTTPAGRDGAVTIVTSVSPPGGDATEPVAAHTERFVQAVWALDRELAYARHYPAVSWERSFSRDGEAIGRWHTVHDDPDWAVRRARLHALLGEADRLQGIAELVGVGALPTDERVALLGGRLAREAVLQQSALSEHDAFCSPAKQSAIVRPCSTSSTCPVARPIGGSGERHRVFDFGPLVRAKDAVGSDDADGVLRIAADVRRGLEELHRDGRTPERLLAPIEVSGIERVDGPLLFVTGTMGAAWDEYVRIRLADGSMRRGIVVDVDRELAIVEVFEGTDGIGLEGASVVFTGTPLRLPVSERWLGRISNGRGDPLDGGPPVTSDVRRPVSGETVNPAHRDVPRDPVITGVSAIDGLATLVRGQKLPIFSVGGLPHLELAIQIAAQATVEGAEFRVVFAGIGITNADADLVRRGLEERVHRGEAALFLNMADDPTIERILTPRLASPWPNTSRSIWTCTCWWC